MGSFTRFWRLSRRDRSTVIESAAVIMATRAGLRVLGYRRLKSILAKLASALVTHPSNSDPDSTNRALMVSAPADFERLIASAARRLFFQSTCLERSIGLWWLLRRHDFDAEIHIGGRKDGDRFEAHAWVESGGVVLSDVGDEHQRYATFVDSGAIAGRELR